MPSIVSVRFYAELNDFVASAKRYCDIECAVAPGQTVKDLIEAQGVPHTEVDLIVVGGESVTFEHRVVDGDHVSVYPVFESFDVAPVTKLRTQPLRLTRFLADGNVNQLARYLRLCGFDTTCLGAVDDAELVNVASREARLLLTRDVGVLKRSAVTHGYFVRSTDPKEQLVEVMSRFHLCGDARPFTRCMNCNGELAVVDKKEVLEGLQPDTRTHYEEFMRCPVCSRVYWKGSHYDKLVALVDDALRESEVAREVNGP